MFAKRIKRSISLTKAWWMKNFLNLQGTTLKPGQKSEPKDSKKKGHSTRYKRGQWNDYGSTPDPSKGLVTVYQGRSVEPLGSTVKNE
eukprot:1307447-Prorocentrum_lima.AAC.1